MANPHQDLTVRVYDGYAKTTLEDELTGPYNALRFSTAIHGGFKAATVTVAMDLAQVWLYLNRENLPGRHFFHIEIVQDKRVVWEGRIMDPELVIDGQFVGVSLTCLGYWSSCRDQYYDADDPGNTDWTAGGPHVTSDVIKELLTNECPDINTNQAGIETTTQDVEGIDLTARDFPMNIILDKLAPLGDASNKVMLFSIWEDRKAYFSARSVTEIDWYVWLSDISRLRLRQQARHLRNSILPVVGSTEGTAADDTDSQALYPKRELKLALPTGTPANQEDLARDIMLEERKQPRQDQTFTVKGRIYSTRPFGQEATNEPIAAGAMLERPKWWVRAGDVIRVQDLIPESVAPPALDDLRTFLIMETQYDAITDTLTVRPDRASGRLSVLLAQISQLERDR